MIFVLFLYEKSNLKK